MNDTLRALLGAFVLSVLTAQSAAALEPKDLYGKWCGSASYYVFSPELMIAEVYSDKSNRKFEITEYHIEEGVVTLHYWIGERAEKRWTEFSDFNADRTKMAQLSSKVGPRREFRRC